MKQLIMILLPLLTCLYTEAQPNPGSAIQTQINGYYQQAMQYKNGNGVAMDYTKAVYYLTRPPSWAMRKAPTLLPI